MLRVTRRLATGAALLLLTAKAVAGATLTPVTADELRAALDATRGAVVLVNFWATWCSPCLKEIPVFIELSEQYGEQGFRLVAVSLDDIDSMNEQVQPFMAKWFPGFTSYIGASYDMDEIVSALDGSWNEVLPTSYLLSRDGKVAERLQGVYTKDEFAAKITALLDNN